MKFIILCYPRTGSTLLITALGAHPKIRQGMDIFNPEQEGDDPWVHWRRETLAALYGEQLNYLNEQKKLDGTRFDLSRLAQAFFQDFDGTKLMYDHLSPDSSVWNYLRSLEDLRVIVLTRNIVEAAISFRVAMTTNIWFSPNSHSPIWYVPGANALPPSPSLTYETWYFDWFYQYYCSQQDYFTGLFSSEAQLCIDYGDLIANWDTALARVQTHLEVEPISMPKMFEKRTQGSLETLVENWEEILDYYKDHPILAPQFKTAFQGQDVCLSQDLKQVSDPASESKLVNPLSFNLSQTFCILPFSQIVIDNGSKIKLCSQTLNLDLETQGQVLSLENMSLEEAWNSTYFQALRRSLATGEKVSSCQKCYQKEQDGGTSLRQICSTYFPVRMRAQTGAELETEVKSIIEENQGQAPFPSALHLWLGKTCNLQCRMCSPEYSSKIEQDPVHSRWYGGDGEAGSQSLNRLDWSQDKNILFGQVLACPENLRFINFSGGEPLINPSLIPILERLVATGAASHIFLYINTNGTRYSSRLSQLLQQFQEVELAISVDGFESAQDYIRYPARWEKICRNILAFQGDNLRLSLRPTVQAYNIFSLLDLARWCDAQTLPFYLDNILVEPRFLSLDMLPRGVVNEVLGEWASYLEQECASENRWHVETLIAALKRPRLDDAQLSLLQQDFSRFTQELDHSRRQSLALACPRLYQSLQTHGVNVSPLPSLHQPKAMVQTLTQALAVITSCEVNDQHGSGALVERMLTGAPQILSLRSLDLYGGAQEFGAFNCRVDLKDLTREAALETLAQAVSGHWINQIYCAPYLPEDVVLALSLQELYSAPMIVHILEDQNINTKNIKGIGDDLMSELLSKARLRFVTHPELREAYENKYGFKFWLLPSVVNPALIPENPAPPKETIVYPDSVGALIGAVEPRAALPLLRETLTAAGIALDWYNGFSGELGADLYADLQASPELVQSWGLNPQEALGEAELTKRLRTYPYLVVPASADEPWNQNPRLWRVLFAVATAHLPVIILGHPHSSAAHFVQKFQLGLACEYKGEELKRAAAQLCQPETRNWIFHQGKTLAPQLGAGDLYSWLKDSLALGKPKDFRFEKLLAYGSGERYHFPPPSPPVLTPEEVYQDFPHTIIQAYDGHVVGSNNRDYIDMMSAWGSNILGYGYPRVAQAISEQVSKYTNVGLVGPEWYELQSLLLRLAPGVEAIHLVKNGSDATAAAVRLARHITQRDIILHRGYHGVQDWYMAALNCPGVPQSQRGQIITLETLEVERVAAILQAYPQRVACLILDPMVWPLPDRETLGAIQALLQEAGTLLIFDEVVSGFRVAPGGAQEFWQIQADLVCYGKCIANGLPLAVLAGRQSLMAQVSDISYGLTFGLEAVSIVAAVATLSEIVERDVCSALAEKGRFLKQTYDQLCQRQGLESALVGHDCRPEIWFPAASPLPPDFCKNLLIRELSRQGVSSYGFFNLCYAHTQADLDQTVVGLERGLDILASLIQAPQSWERRRLESLGETVKDLTGQLRQSQEILSQALTEKERLTAELNAQLQQSQQSLSQWQGEATGLKTQLQQESQRLTEVQGEIEAMQTSKFWRLRGQWFRLKRKLGLPIV